MPPCYHQHTPRALAESYQKAAARRDFDAVVACVAPGDRQGIAALIDAMRDLYRELPELLATVRGDFGPEGARELRANTDGAGIPSPLSINERVISPQLPDVTIDDRGDVALYSLAGRLVGKARLIALNWYFVAGDDEYALAFGPNPMAVAMWEGPLKELKGLASKMEAGRITEAEARELLLGQDGPARSRPAAEDRGQRPSAPDTAG